MRVYGFGVEEIESGVISFERAANCAAHLPWGSAIYEYYGGWPSLTQDVIATMEQTHVLLLVNTDKKHRSQVKEPKPPKGIREREVEAREVEEHRAKFWAEDAEFEKTKAAGGTWGDLA